MTKNKIILAHANGVLDNLRRAEIEKRIALKYTPMQEFRLYADKESNLDAWNEHEKFVSEIKSTVDKEISEVIGDEA